MTSSFTFVEKYPQNKKSSIAIKPYFDPSVENMGLEHYGLSVFDNTFHEEELTCLEVNGVKRYITGLNEFAPEIKMIQNEDDRKAKIEDIRRTVAQLEKELAANVVETKDPEFWNKVKLLRPDNSEFWSNIKIRCSNDPVFLEPATDPYDLIKLLAIEAGGFSIVARSLEDARKRSTAPKFYLDKLEDTASVKTEVKKLRNRAGSELSTLFEKNQNKLFYVAKILDVDSGQYKKSTPNDIIYDNMDKYINGELVDKNKKACAQKFLNTCELDMETLKIRAIIKDAAFYREIATKSDGYIWHLKSGSMMGKNPSDVLEYLKNPLNEQVLVELTKAIEKYWNQ